MGITTVMMKTIIKPASLMEEIAVDLMLIQIIAMYVNALKRFTISNSNHRKNSDYHIQTNFKPNNEIKIIIT